MSYQGNERYNPVYSKTFGENIKSLVNDTKTKRVLKKDIRLILSKPYYKAEKVKSYSGSCTMFRKWVCGGELRIFYRVNKKKRKVEFYILRPKGKGTYKNL